MNATKRNRWLVGCAVRFLVDGTEMEGVILRAPLDQDDGAALRPDVNCWKVETELGVFDVISAKAV